MVDIIFSSHTSQPDKNVADISNKQRDPCVLGIDVILTCREDELEKAHFDTRQYNHVVWKDEKDLFVKLKRRIEATISA